MIDLSFLENEEITVEEIRENMATVTNEIRNLESAFEATSNELEKVKNINISLYSKLTNNENEENEENEEEIITLNDIFD